MENLANSIAVFFILHFCWSYYFNCYRKGYTIDLWHFWLLNSVVVIHVMLFFSRSDLNIIALGVMLHRAQAHITEAYFISAFGYACLLLGGSIWRIKLGLGIRRLFSSIVEVPSHWSLFLLENKSLLLAHGLIAIAMSCGVLGYYFKTEGFGFNLRSILITTPWLRPIAQFTAFYSILIGSYCLYRYYQKRERTMLLVFCLIFFAQLFYGERANLVALIAGPMFVSALKLRRRLRPVYVLGVVVGILIFVMMLDALRQPSYSLEQAVGNFVLNLFYGNSFSDLRDFALVLSYWDGHYLAGLTYLAGIFAFIPRYLSTFRDTYSLGVVTATMAGISPTEHPGLRVGTFGESFLNFGIVGVGLLGLITGAISRLIDLRMKQAIAQLPRKSMVVFSYFAISGYAAVTSNSGAASAAYSVTLIFALSWVMVEAARFLKIKI